MNTELVKKLVELFLNWSQEDQEVIDWSFENNILLVKTKDMENGAVFIYEFNCSELGYARTLNQNDFSVVEI